MWRSSLAQVKKCAASKKSSLVLISRHCSCVSVQKIDDSSDQESPVLTLVRVTFVSWSFVVSHFDMRSSKSSGWKQASRSSGSRKNIQDLVTEITSLKNELEQMQSTLLKADFFLRYTLLHATSGDPNVLVRRIMQTSNSGSGAVTGLESWRQMTYQFAGSSKTRMVTLLRQIMLPVEWNVEKSNDVTQQCYRWLELISKYEAINGENVTDKRKITLALQNVRGNLAQPLTCQCQRATSLNGHKFILFSSTTSTMQHQWTQKIY